MKLFSLIILILSLFSCVFAQVARKVDEFGDISCAGVTSSTSNFFEDIKKTEDSNGYIIVYNGRLNHNAQNKPLYPHRNEAKAEIENIKSIINFFRFDKKRLVFIEGGLKEYFTIEFWIVPSDATPPVPAPTLKKMKYQKGKARRLCEAF